MSRIWMLTLMALRNLTGHGVGTGRVENRLVDDLRRAG
jgi:hypothetical protein